MPNPTIRALVRGTYDLQKMRIQSGNRVVANFKAKLGQKPGTKEEQDISPDDLRLLKELRARFRLITEGVKNITRLKGWEGDELISDHAELALIAQYDSLITAEELSFKLVEYQVHGHPLWDAFLKGVKGCGPAMSGVIISELDPHKGRHPSSFWRYAGLDVADDGAGRSKRKEHLIEIEYEAADGTTKKRMGVTYNPFLKTKLMGVLAASFLKAGDHYKEVYDNYKHRLECHAKWGKHNDKKKRDDGKMITWPGRRHKMAMRYMVKMFLIDLHMKWRAIEGLPVSRPYHDDKLGHGDAA